LSSGSKAVCRHTVSLRSDLVPGDSLNTVPQDVIDSLRDLGVPGTRHVAAAAGVVVDEADGELLDDCLAVCFRRRQRCPDYLLDFCNHGTIIDRASDQVVVPVAVMGSVANNRSCRGRRRVTRRDGDCRLRKRQQLRGPNRWQPVGPKDRSTTTPRVAWVGQRVRARRTMLPPGSRCRCEGGVWRS